MKNLTKTLFIVAILATFVLVTSPAQAYFGQSNSYPNPQYNPYRYGYQDHVSSMIQGHLNFVSNFIFYPSPARQYFYNYYSPYSYYGGYGYGWGY